MSHAITAAGLRATTATTGTRPRCRILIANAVQDGSYLENFQTHTSVYARDNTFTAKVALRVVGPGSRLTSPYWFDPATDSNGEVAPVDVQIQMGFLADGAAEGTNAWTTMFQGIIDQINYQPATGSLTITGRDYLGKLHDLAVQESWLNHTAAEILTLLIQAAGLTANVTMPTALDGQFYQIEHKRLALVGSHRFESAFDLAHFLCNSAQCDIWTEGKTVYVAPRGSNTTTNTITYAPPGNKPYAQLPAMDLSLDRDLLIGRGVVVQVSSRDIRQRATHTWYWSAKGASRTAPSTVNSAVYAFTRPGLSDQKAHDYALARYLEAIAHSRVATLSMPGELDITPRQRVQLLGTGTSWDQTYSVDALDRSFSVEGGFTQTLTLRNRLTDTDQA